jgi:hypothetical protein
MLTHSQPTLVQALTNHRIISIASGNHHTLFLTASGTVYASGRNDCWQLGFGAHLSPTFATPVLVTGVQGITRIGCGSDHSLAVDAQGRLYTWGWGEEYMLGTGKKVNEPLPVAFQWRVRKERRAALAVGEKLGERVSTPACKETPGDDEAPRVGGGGNSSSPGTAAGDSRAPLCLGGLPSSEMEEPGFLDALPSRESSEPKAPAPKPKRWEMVRGLRVTKAVAAARYTVILACRQEDASPSLMASVPQ